MTKLRNLLTIALLILPAVTVNAGSLPSGAARAGLSSTQSVTGSCYVFMYGRWWEVPC